MKTFIKNGSLCFMTNFYPDTVWTLRSHEQVEGVL
jgi:hypothetical protein